MKTRLQLLFLTACLTLPPLTAHADWQPVEKVQTYAVSGKSGAELYASIGERGPKVGIGRVIALTNFTLTWTRKYEPRDGACVLVSARPKLTITYSLPKPAGTLPASIRESWETFAAGVRKHELVHGDMIEDMVRKIEAATVGLTVPDDPGCSKIRAEMQPLLSNLSLEQRQKSRDFDRVELSEGGAVHQLILALVNGP